MCPPNEVALLDILFNSSTYDSFQTALSVLSCRASTLVNERTHYARLASSVTARTNWPCTVTTTAPQQPLSLLSTDNAPDARGIPHSMMNSSAMVHNDTNVTTPQSVIVTRYTPSDLCRPPDYTTINVESDCDAAPGLPSSDWIDSALRGHMESCTNTLPMVCCNIGQRC